MKKRFFLKLLSVLVLVTLSMTLLMGCNGKIDDSIDNDDGGITPDEPIKNTEKFDFAYEKYTESISKGNRADFYITLKNASEDDYVYTGSVLDFSPQAVLYCVVDGERYEFNIQHYYMMVVDASDDESSYSVKSTEMQISAFPPNIYKASDMEKIESFKVNHELLKRGIYVSRKDYNNKTSC